MKLQNKKTGGLATLVENEDCLTLKTDAGFHHYLSLAELNEDWEDYEEPKKYYYITSCGEITHRGYRLWENESVYDKKRKQIGNYFETEAEAEKAVEKLKAWKRLKDGGVKFDLATLSDDTTIVMFARKKKHIHDYDKEIFMLFEDKE